jgi:hypothetical protein
VSSAPLITPFFRIVDATVASAIAPPTQGNDRDSRRDSRAPPHLATRWVIVMPLEMQAAFPPARHESIQERALFPERKPRDRARSMTQRVRESVRIPGRLAHL